MSTPIDQQLGVNSPIFDEEWQNFLKRRQEMLDTISKRISLGDQLTTAYPGMSRDHVQSIADAISQGTEHTSIPQDQNLQDLIGRAHFYGITDPEKVPPDVLQHMIESRRDMMRADRIQSNESDHPVLSTLADFGAAAFVGSTETLLKAVQHVPLLGDALAHTYAVKSAEQWLGMVDEGFRADMFTGEAKGYDIGKALSGMVAYMVPATAAWKVAGAIGGLGSVAEYGTRLGPIAKMAIRGAASGWMLQGGGDESIQQKAINIALMAGMGAAQGVGGPVAGAVGGAMMGEMAGQAVGHPLMGAAVGTVGGSILAMQGLGARANKSFRGADFAEEYTGPLGQDVGSYTQPQGPRLLQAGIPEADWSVVDPSGKPVGPGSPPSAPGSGPAAMLPSVAPQEPASAGGPPTQPLYPALPGVDNTRLPGAVTPESPLGWPADYIQVAKPGRNLLIGPNNSANGLANGRYVTYETDTPTGGRMEINAGLYSVEPGRLDLHIQDLAPVLSAQEGGMLTRSYNQRDAMGLANLRDTFKSFVSDLNEQGIYPTHIIGQHVSGTWGGKQWDRIPLVNIEVPVSRLFRGLSTPAEAAADGAAMSKAASIVESPAAAELAPQPGFDDADVAKAKMASNPGAINIIRNVGDVAKTVSSLVRQQTEGRLMPHQFRVIEHSVPVEDWMKSKGAQPAIRFTSHVSPSGYEIFRGSTPEEARQSAVDVYRYSNYSAPVATHVNDVGQPTGGYSVGNTPETVVYDQQQLQAAHDYVSKNGEPGWYVDNKFIPQHKLQEAFVPYENVRRYDILVSDGMPITNKRVAQYKEHGFFEGQKAVTHEGIEGVVKGFSKDGSLVEVHSPTSGQSYFVEKESLLPGDHTYGPEEVLGGDAATFYETFRAHALNSIYDESVAAGIPLPEWTDTQVSSQLPRLMGEFFDKTGVTNPVTRAALRNYFDIQRLNDYRQLAPQEDQQLAQSIQKEVAIASADQEPSANWLEEMANAKGMGVVRAESSPGITLIDRLSDESINVESDHAAAAFLNSFNREMPDIGPIGNAPEELFEPAGNPGADIEPEPMTMAAHMDMIESAASDIDQHMMENEIAAGGGGGAPPQIPPRAPSGPDYPENELPPGEGQRQIPTTTLGRQFRMARQYNLEALAEAERAMLSQWDRWTTPHRDKTLQIEELLHKAGIDAASFWGDMNDVKTKRAIAHNEAMPWLREANIIFTQFNREHLRDGTVTRIQEIADPIAKQHAMDAAGYSAREMIAQNKIGDFNDRFFQFMVEDPSFNLSWDRYMQAYMSHIRSARSQNVAEWWRDDTGILPHRIKFFAELVREGLIDDREMDPRKLTYRMVRGAMFHKHIRGAWEKAAEWDNPQIPPAFRDFAKGWLFAVRNGGTPEHDAVVEASKEILRKVGLPVTSNDMRALYGGAIANTYRAMLGWRPDVLFRDMIQPLMAGVQVGMSHTFGAYTDYLKGGAVRSEMWDRGMKHGWVEVGQVKTPNSDLFRQEEFRPEHVDYLTQPEAARREVIEKGIDLLWDILPPSARQGIQERLIDPLHPYTVLGMVNRLIAGETGWKFSGRLLDLYGNGKLTHQQLLNSIQMFEAPIQRRFDGLVLAGQYEQAQALIANETANSQFRYGAIEQPEGIRKAGMVGRLGAMFGTFTLQYAHWLKARLTNGSPAQIAAMAARYAAVAGAIYLAAKKTGWRNLNRLQWHTSLTFAGGPLIGVAGLAIQAGQGVARELGQATGTSSSGATYAQQDAMRQMSPGNLVGGFLENTFPFKGAFTTGQGLLESLNVPNYPEATMRFLMTGEKGGNAPEIRNYLSGFEFDPIQGTAGFQQPAPVVGPQSAYGAPQHQPLPAPAEPETPLSPQQQMLLRTRRPQVTPGGSPITGAQY